MEISGITHLKNRDSSTKRSLSAVRYWKSSAPGPVVWQISFVLVIGILMIAMFGFIASLIW